MSEALLNALATQTLVLALAAVLVLALRRVLARRLGAGLAYRAWLLVPIAAFAAWLPHRAGGPVVLRVDVPQSLAAWSAQVVAMPAAVPALALRAAATAWAVGVLVVVGTAAWRQWRFMARLVAGAGPGSTTSALTSPAADGPFVLGLLRPRLVLPADFESRYDAAERALVLAHEAVHLRRRDNAWNLLAGALLALHWFNPIAWLAWRRMRLDQELSCDAAALRGADRDAVRVYLRALMKAQGDALQPALGCAWQSCHPLVERVRMITVHSRSVAGRRAGRIVLAGTIVLGCAVGYAVQPQAGQWAEAALPADTVTQVDGDLRTTVTVQVDDLIARRAEPVTNANGTTWRFTPDARTGLAQPIELGLHVDAMRGGALVASALHSDDLPQLVAHPRVLTHLGEPARVEIRTDGDRHKIVVTFVASAAPGAR